MARGSSSSGKAASRAGCGRGSAGRGQVPTDQYMKAAIAKTIREQFKDMSEHELYSKLIDGVVLHDRLCQDRKDWLMKTARGKAISLGPAYYRELRDKYTDEASPMKSLQWDRSLEENNAHVSRSLDQAMNMFNRSRPCRGPFMQWCSSVIKMTNKEQPVIKMHRRAFEMEPLL